MTAKFFPPQMDKGHSLQFFGDVTKKRGEIISLMYDAKKKFYCLPFLQGDQPDWIMIEFWSDDLSEIKKAVQFFSESLKIPVAKA